MKHRTPQRPGVVLLLSLLLMAAIVSSTIAIATSVADSTHQSRNLDDFVIASLAADTGLERSLDIVKTGRLSGANIAATTTGSNQTATALSSVASVGVAAASANQPVVIPQLQPQNSLTFDILAYDPVSGSLHSVTSSASLTVTGDGQHCTISAPIPAPAPVCKGQLEISWLGLDLSGQPFYSGRVVLNNSQLDGASRTVSLTTNVRSPDNDSAPSNINSTTGFRVTVRALDSSPHDANLTIGQVAQQLTVKNITVTQSAAASCPGGACSTGVISLTSTGSSGTSQSIKQASVLWQLPASQLFNYVVFTEGDIIPSS